MSLLWFHWPVLFQLLPDCFLCSGSADVCEDVRRGLCGCGRDVPEASRVNDSRSELCDSSSMLERSCGPCSCLVVVE